MSTAQRVSRGFHWLAIFLAAVPLIVGVVLSFVVASGRADNARRDHDEQINLVCAQTALKSGTVKSMYSNLPSGYLADDERVDLVQLGCTKLWWKPTVHEIWEAKPPGNFSYTASFLPVLGVGLVITLVVSLIAYGVARAIGWVIGGFVAT